MARSNPTARTPPPPPRFETSRFWRLLPAGMRRRWWLFRLFDLIAYHWPVLGPHHGLLVVRMDGIGDMVLFRGALDRYAEAFGVAASEITVLGCESWAPLAPALFEGYRVETINEHAYARRPLYRLQVNLRVRAMAPAIVVNDSYFRRALMADSLTWVCRAPRSIVSLPYISERTRPEFAYYLSQVDVVVDTGPYSTHETVRHYRFLSAVAGTDIEPVAPDLRWPASPPPIAEGSPYVVLNPGSNEPGRRWPIDRYAGLAKWFLGQGYRVCVVGNEQEENRKNAFAGTSQKQGFIDLIGKTDLKQLLDVLAHAALVVTNDTGPAHLSIGLGTPTAVIVGGGHFGCFVPYPPELSPAHARFAYRAMECYHCFWRCHLRTDKSQSFPCVAEITEDDVKAACTELLSGTTAEG